MLQIIPSGIAKSEEARVYSENADQIAAKYQKGMPRMANTLHAFLFWSPPCSKLCHLAGQLLVLLDLIHQLRLHLSPQLLLHLQLPAVNVGCE